MQNNNRSKLLIIIGGIWLFLMLLNSFSSNAAMKTLPYSEFLKLAKEGKISEVAVTDNVIQGVMLDVNSESGRGERFRTVRVDPDVSGVLEQNGIEYSGKIQSNFIANIFSWVFPVLLFLGIWYFIMRRFQQQQGRKDILNVHLKKITTAENLDVDTLAGMTPGMVGADLANLVNEAALLSVRRKKDEVGMAEFEEAVERVVAGLEKKNRLINPVEKEIVAYHELGHAIVAMTLPETDPVQKISIIPRGIAALGYTMQVPTEDRFLMRRAELLNRIATLLGGRAAEEIIFDDISTGAQNDLSRATDIARSMVKEYGMSGNLGQVYFAHKKQSQFLNPNQEGSGDYSAMTAHLIDKEIRQIIDEQYERALEILRSKRNILNQAAETLIESETIQGDELDVLEAAVLKDTDLTDETDVSDDRHAMAA